MLGGVEYAVDILKVQEIRGVDSMTAVPGLPRFVKGVISLRGIPVPVLDMRIKFELGHATYDELSAVIVLNVENRLLGLVVDGVSDVISLICDRSGTAPDCTSSMGAIDGQGVLGRTILFVDVEKLMDGRETTLQPSEALGYTCQ